MNRDEAMHDLVHGVAHDVAADALNAGKGREFLLSNGWDEETINEHLARRMGEEDDPIHMRINDERRSLDDTELDAFVERVKAEILEDMGKAVSSQSKAMPLTVGIPSFAKRRGHADGIPGMEHGGYSELHDYVDANCYGGACDDNSTVTMGDVIAMQKRINEWLVSGDALAEKEAQILPGE